MRKIKTLLAYCGVFTLLFTSCSKDEPAQMGDVPTGDDFAVLTFNSVLNDLSNRASQKAHFDQVPDCSEDAPSYAQVTYSVNGADAVMATVEILSENGEYFTAYSEGLKVPIASNGSAMVSLEGFKVYSDSDELIWAAPVRTNSDVDQFDSYVDQSLPFSTEIYAGSKPYIDVEVLCFDRRMANEYGYVFFDIIPKTIYPLCLFANYCNADGRHWVADYSINLDYGVEGEAMTSLYTSSQATAQATTGVETNGEYYADPLCLVVPGPPANLANDEAYLTLTVFPSDWNASGSYGDVDNSGVVIELSWNDVNALLNSDGTTNEYLHILLGECDDALSGDGTISPGEGTGGNGGNDCVATDAEADCDADGTLNKCDVDSPYYNTFDCDGDGIANGDENDGCVNNPDTTCGETVDPEPETCEIDSPEAGCDTYYALGDDTFIEATVSGIGAPIYIALNGEGVSASIGTLTWNLSEDMEPVIIVTLNEGYSLDDYKITVKDAVDSTEYCVAMNDVSPAGANSPDLSLTLEAAAGFDNVFYYMVELNACASN